MLPPNPGSAIMVARDVLILVVDDQRDILEIVEGALEDGGFHVITASSGEDAIEVLETANHDFRALITDVNLAPLKATGWDVAHRARQLIPGLPVIYITATDAHDWGAHGVSESVL